MSRLISQKPYLLVLVLLSLTWHANQALEPIFAAFSIVSKSLLLSCIWLHLKTFPLANETKDDGTQKPSKVYTADPTPDAELIYTHQGILSPS